MRSFDKSFVADEGTSETERLEFATMDADQDVEAGSEADAHSESTAKVKTSKEKSQQKQNKTEDELAKTRLIVEKEKLAKRKLYSSLVKLAKELKRTRAEARDLIEAAEFADKAWYEGGMWRRPALLPGVNDPSPKRAIREAVSLSDLFFDLVIVTALTRVGVAIQDRGHVDAPILAYFAIFWFVWEKEASYSTRFDTTDLSSRLEMLVTCFAVLFGSFSSTAPFESAEATRMMMVAAFVALLHFFLHLRVFFWFKGADPMSELNAVKNYAVFIMTMTMLETLTWFVGIFLVPVTSKHRNIIFILGILLSFRVPKTFLPNDFHAACSKRGVLFIMLLGFLVQSIVFVATPFFDYQIPSTAQYVFLGLVIFLLYCIKLCYVDDSFSVDPQDHALLVNRAAGFFFHVGQFTLLLSTTVLGAGLNLLTHSYLAATEALPDNAKTLVCGGFAGVVVSIAFIKSMHLRRVPLNPVHQRIFFAAYGTQIVVLVAVVYVSLKMCFERNGFFESLMSNEIEMLSVLSGAALFLLVMSWLDEAVELNLYGNCDAREFRVHPFGFWWCLKPEEPDPPLLGYQQGVPDKRLSHLSPFLTASQVNLFESQGSFYGSTRSIFNSTSVGILEDEDQ